MTYLGKIISAPLLLLIRIYQKTLSPDHGPLRHLHSGGFCRYYPTCSEYTHQAVERFGALKGLFLGAWRVLHCHPWAKGGHDPIPQ